MEKHTVSAEDDVMVKQRRSQRSRSMSTQAQILKAALGILFTQGFAAATVQNVAARAGVSRGAMLYHFPTKTNLMVAVMRHAHEADVRELRNGLQQMSSPLDRLYALPALTWRSLSGPSGVAALEIMMGSRNDRELAGALEVVQSKIERESHEQISYMIRAADMNVTQEDMELVELVVAAIRGLSIEMMFRKAPVNPPPALDTLRAIIESRLPRPLRD